MAVSPMTNKWPPVKAIVPFAKPGANEDTSYSPLPLAVAITVRRLVNASAATSLSVLTQIAVETCRSSSRLTEDLRCELRHHRFSRARCEAPAHPDSQSHRRVKVIAASSPSLGSFTDNHQAHEKRSADATVHRLDHKTTRQDVWNWVAGSHSGEPTVPLQRSRLSCGSPKVMPAAET